MTEGLAAVRIARRSDVAAISELLFEFNGEGLLPEALTARMEEASGLETVFLGERAGAPACWF